MALKRKRRRKTTFNVKTLVGFMTAVLFVLGLVLVAQGFIDTHNYRDEFIRIVKEKTGKDITIKGNVTISLLPTPTIYIPGVELRDLDTTKPIPAATVEMIQLDVPLTAVFSDSPRITGATLYGPQLEITRARDNHIYWDWMENGVLKSFLDKGASALSVAVVDGKVTYHDESSDRGMEVNNIGLSLTTGAQMVLRGGLTFYGHNLKFSADTHASAHGAADALTARLYADGKNALELDGTVDSNGDLPKVKGTLKLTLEDLPVWLKPKDEDKQALLEQVTNEFKKSEDKKQMLPLNFTGNWSSEGLDVDLSDVQFQGLNSTGKGDIRLLWSRDGPEIRSDLAFTSLDYGEWSLLAGEMADDENHPLPAFDEDENPLPKNFRVVLHVAADKVTMGAQTWEHANLSMSLADAMLTVNQFNIDLPGKSTLTLFGIISQASTKGLRFEGSLETEGASLREMLTVFDESASDLPETGFGKFSMRSNIFLSPEQMRLSEADVKMSDLRLNGGLVAYYDGHPRMEADVKLKDINFDYFRDVWRKKQEGAGNQDFFLKFDKTMNFNWLKKLNTTIDFKVNVERFTFMERRGDSASFRIFAKEGEFGIYDIRFYYTYDITQGSFMLNVKGEQPFVNLVLNTNEMNTSYFSVHRSESVPAQVSAPSVPAGGGAAPDTDVPVPPPPPPPPVVSKPSSEESKAPDMTPPPAAVVPKPVTLPDKGAVPPAPPLPAPEEKAPEAQDKQVMPPPPLPESAVPLPGKGKEAPAPKEPFKFVPTDRSRIDAEGVVAPKEKPAKAKTLEITPQAEEIVLGDNGTQAAMPESRKWSEDLIDMSWMEGFNGAFDISINKLTYGDKVIDRFKMQAKLENNLLTFQNFNFIYWQARCSVLGAMYGGKVPGISISFTLYNAELQDMLKALTGRDNITGKASFSGSLTTSGVNALSWVQQSEAKLVMSARGVLVKNLNLQGVVDAVGVSRTAADVFNNVNLGVVNGTTEMNVDGTLNVHNGVMKTPGITLKSGLIIGDLRGEIRMVPWLMDLSTMFQFPTMTSETIPTMTIQLTGPVEAPEFKTDTSSLEAYVAKKIISR